MLLNATPDAAALVNVEGIVLASNEKYAEKYHKTSEQLLGSCMYDLFPPELATKRRLSHDQAVRLGNPIRNQEQRDEAWFETSVYPIADAEGNVSRLAIFEKDISERKRSDEELRQTVESYRSSFDRMLDGIYRSTHDGRFVDVNPAFVKMFGYSSRQEMLDIVDIKKELYFSPEERGSHFLDTGQEEVEVFRMRRKDGSEIWVEDHGRYVHDEHGNIIYHEGLLRDITERRRLEAELRSYSDHLEELVAERTSKLRQSEEEFRELFEACPISLWEEDFSTVKAYLNELRRGGVSDFKGYFTTHPEDIAKCSCMVKVLSVNEATLKLYGARTVSEIVDGLSNVLTVDSCDVFGDELVALAEGKVYFASQIDNQTLTGETKNVNLICAVVPGHEETLSRVLVCILDVTQERRLEAELVESQRLAAIGATTAMVGHDLRNPLQGMTGLIYLLKKQFEHPPRGQQKKAGKLDVTETLDMIEESVAYMNKIVSDLQNYAAPLHPELLTVNTEKLLDETISTMRIPSSVKIDVTVKEDAAMLTVDPSLMKRVLVNLVNNAIQAMPHGGRLKVTAERGGEETLIRLQDTGVGIPKETLPKLFDPFVTTKAQGQGLGLAVCKRLVEAHGGTITVESTVGEGSTFIVKIPVSKEGSLSGSTRLEE